MASKTAKIALATNVYKYHKYHRFFDGDQWDAMLALEQRFDVWLKNRCCWSFNYVGYLFF